MEEEICTLPEDVPEGLEEVLVEFSKEVFKKRPSDIYTCLASFCISKIGDFERLKEIISLERPCEEGCECFLQDLTNSDCLKDKISAALSNAFNLVGSMQQVHRSVSECFPNVKNVGEDGSKLSDAEISDRVHSLVSYLDQLARNFDSLLGNTDCKLHGIFKENKENMTDGNENSSKKPAPSGDNSNSKLIQKSSSTQSSQTNRTGDENGKNLEKSESQIHEQTQTSLPDTSQVEESVLNATSKQKMQQNILQSAKSTQVADNLEEAKKSHSTQSQNSQNSKIEPKSSPSKIIPNPSISVIEVVEVTEEDEHIEYEILPKSKISQPNSVNVPTSSKSALKLNANSTGSSSTNKTKNNEKKTFGETLRGLNANLTLSEMILDTENLAVVNTAVKEFLGTHIYIIQEVLTGEKGFSEAPVHVAVLAVSFVMGIVAGYKLVGGRSASIDSCDFYSRITNTLPPSPNMGYI